METGSRESAPSVSRNMSRAWSWAGWSACVCFTQSVFGSGGSKRAQEPVQHHTLTSIEQRFDDYDDSRDTRIVWRLRLLHSGRPNGCGRVC